MWHTQRPILYSPRSRSCSHAFFSPNRVKKADKNKGATGSPVYMAPEVLADKAYDEKADVFSFAVVLWELVTNKKPYEEEQFESLDGTAVYSQLIRRLATSLYIHTSPLSLRLYRNLRPRGDRWRSTQASR